VEYQDYNGVKKEAHYVGLSARCFLHELDHMNGIVYTSRTKPLALQMALKKRNKLIKTIVRGQKRQAEAMKQIARVAARKSYKDGNKVETISTN
jgi:hypothetical protein